MALLLLVSAGCSPRLDEFYIDDIDCEPTPDSRSGANVDAQYQVALTTSPSLAPRTKAEPALSTEPVRFASSALDEAFRPVAGSNAAPRAARRAPSDPRMHE